MINVTIRYDNNERQIDFPCSGHVLDAKLKDFEILRSSGKPYIIRTPLIPDVCDTEDNLSKIKQIIGKSKWEQLPYNQMAGAKYEMLNMVYPMCWKKESAL